MASFAALPCAANARSSETAVTAGVLRKVLLVVILSVVKGLQRSYFRADVAQTRRVQLSLVGRT